jgi:fructose-1-phosphate kinase PfkB-like protein
VLDRLTEGAVNRSAVHMLDAGGKGIDVARVLVQLGERVVHLTQAGGRNRELFLKLAASDGIQVRWIDSCSEIRFCYTLLSKEKHTTTEIVEEAEGVAAGTNELIYASYISLLDDAHTVIISGTKAPGFSDSLYPAMVAEAKRRDRLVVLDIRGKDLGESLVAKPDVIKPNYDEFVGTFFNTDSVASPAAISEERVKAKMKEIYDLWGTSSVITRGEDPFYFADRGKVVTALPKKIVPLNTTGSGDSFCAGFAKAYSESGDMNLAVEKGIDCATRNALRVRPGVIL